MPNKKKAKGTNAERGLERHPDCTGKLHPSAEDASAATDKINREEPVQNADD